MHKNTRNARTCAHTGLRIHVQKIHTGIKTQAHQRSETHTNAHARTRTRMRSLSPGGNAIDIHYFGRHGLLFFSRVAPLGTCIARKILPARLKQPCQPCQPRWAVGALAFAYALACRVPSSTSCTLVATVAPARCTVLVLFAPPFIPRPPPPQTKIQ